MPKARPIASPPEQVISVIGPGMTITGDCETTDSIRIEGTVEGSVRAEKAVVIGKGGKVTGDVSTQDAVIAGSVKGVLQVDSRLELQSTCLIDGEIRAGRLQLDDGGVVIGTVSVGRKDSAGVMVPGTPGPAAPSAGEQPGGLFRAGGKPRARK